MSFAVLTTTELRLLDVMLARGVFLDLPASVLRRDLAATARGDTKRRGFPHLRERIPELTTISSRVGGVLAHGSMAELLSLLARPPGRDPATD